MFQWEKVKLKLPGTEEYNPALLWILNLRANGTIAADIDGYVDDLWLTAPTKELAWQASARIAKVCAFLGLQIALEKVGTRPTSWCMAGSNRCFSPPPNQNGIPGQMG
jgi:hypothetical protein